MIVQRDKKTGKSLNVRWQSFLGEVLLSATLGEISLGENKVLIGTIKSNRGDIGLAFYQIDKPFDPKDYDNTDKIDFRTGDCIIWLGKSKSSIKALREALDRAVEKIEWKK